MQAEAAFIFYPTTPMKKAYPLLVWFTAPVALAAAIANAQSTPPAPLPAKDEEPVTLSPFTVSGSKDVGYTATNTLAGTRLNTP